MKPIYISEVTAQKLRDGDYRSALPEYYLLKEVEENSVWHDHQNVFDHVVKVYENLEINLSSVSPQVQKYLQGRIGNETRENLLKVATLLHDIAKKDTLIIQDGRANCPGHEHVAAGMVKHFSERFELDFSAQERVEKIVLHHGYISDILTQVIYQPLQEDAVWQFFIDTVGDIFYELLLLMHADLNGCDLDKTAPEEYESREKLLVKWLESKKVGL